MKFVFKEWEKRLAVCNGCEHSHPILGQITCGTPLMGETIIVDDKKVKLCGCVMALATKVESKTCPLNKWKK